jgi:hypothetical protein
LAKAFSVARRSPSVVSKATLLRNCGQTRGALAQSRIGADHVVQRLPFDFDRFRRVLGLLDRLGDHRGDGIADVTDFGRGQNRIRRHLNGDAGYLALTRQIAEARRIGTGQDERNARHCARLRDIGYAKARMRMRRPQDNRV